MAGKAGGEKTEQALGRDQGFIVVYIACMHCSYHITDTSVDTSI